jgi:hypothetical protein
VTTGHSEATASGPRLAAPPDKDQSWALIERILQSPSFVRSVRLSALLRHIAKKTIDGETADLSEYQIGVQVFKRPESYSPGEDSIVRSHVRLLRQRLEEYTQEHAETETLRAFIPKGAYSIQFERQPEAVATVAREEIPAVAAAPNAAERLRRHWQLGLAAALLLGLVATAAVWYARSQSQLSPSERLWAQVFRRDAKTFIVSADSALVLVEDLTKQEVPLAQYANRNYRNNHSTLIPDDLLHDIASRRYTSATDLSTIVRLLRVPQAMQSQVVIRYARDLQLTDLKEGSAILLGGLRANPWETLFESKLNFRLAHGEHPNRNIVRNGQPKAGELPQYSEQSGPDHLETYGIVDYLPGLAAGRSVIMIQGTSAAGTECAADFLFDPSALDSFLGTLGNVQTHIPFFEVLLRSKLVDGNAQQHDVVGWRTIR